ncbi:hypothetical protein LEP1GSC043_2108 [Leptospira weilii str. Ecochallenge]|uniref:Uncharacterized protein n=1 Tax=Leptospira weilii str. Ecochallenge TaxID=1049986 RepID=N1U709_9LEPT|nr:hypothetical protein LEP1GSC043_2108 [Leptospira weilii str. Ecochallenge]
MEIFFKILGRDLFSFYLTFYQTRLSSISNVNLMVENEKEYSKSGNPYF